MVNICLKAAKAPSSIAYFGSVSGIQVYPEPARRAGTLDDVTTA